ncbi:MAG: molybdopterin molybdotransferase MoeA [Betaproteobacteria bacterium]|nr:molybdopterin molybdotransferase MoeA [Betaproteobacteria bacterium]MCC6248486.1 molybdopterin molybdotransferase MoeA [Rubrivivax sp.]
MSDPGPSPLGPSPLGPSPLAAGERNLSVDEARAAIAAAIRPLARSESHEVPIDRAVGRVLAADVVSPIDVPAHDNSAMDGYAFAGSALVADAPTVLRAAGIVYAGRPHAGTVPAGQCLRIMTGAVMPEGTDTVVPLELVQVQGAAETGEVHVPPGVIRAGENRRRRGEDLAAGKPALVAGRVLRPADLGLAASLGLTHVRVMRPLRVALFSTGDEVVEPGQALPEGCIYDSNRFSLGAALARLGMEVVDLGLVPDDRAALAAVIERAVREADVVITSGGVSAGDADYTRDILAAAGDVAFWKVAMRPGRPFAFGPLKRPTAAAGGAPSWLFALPGNPVAALVTFYAFVREALLVLAGATAAPLPVLRARSTAAIRKRPGRTEFQRAIVEPAPDGNGWQVRLFGSQGAGVLRSMSEANALVVLGHEQGSVAAGDAVPVWLFDGLV